METQTPFNLIKAIETWRRELLAQPAITSEDCRELERHLQDSVVQLRDMGLSEKEAFWLARQRLGGFQEISQEFAKEDPTKIWQDRLLWIAVALLGLQLWEAICFSLASPFVLIAALLNSVPPWLDALTQVHNLVGNEAIYAVTTIWFAVQVRRGRLGWLLSAWGFLCVSRLRFLTVSVPLVLFLVALPNLWLLPLRELVRNPNDELFSFGSAFLFNGISPIATVGLIAWLIPGRQNQESRFVAAK